jgi:hypothetical protein
MLNKDAFSVGQVNSKLWACRELESTGWTSNLTNIYAGWHGVLSFLLLSRENFDVKQIRSFDIDPACESVADTLNNAWVFEQWKFKAVTKDCNSVSSDTPDLIINTSTEHFDSMDWFNNIPRGTRVVLQGNNQDHDEHIIHSKSLDEFIAHYPLSQIIYKGKLDFKFPDKEYARYMVIGVK